MSAPTVRHAPGTAVVDTATGRTGTLGTYLDVGDPNGVRPDLSTGELAFIRPIGGGVEWTTDPDCVEPQ